MGNRSKLGSWSQQQPRSDHHALEGVRTHGRETALHSRPPARWCAAERAVQALRHQPQDGLQVRSEERRVGKSVDLGGRRIIKKKKKKNNRCIEIEEKEIE